MSTERLSPEDLRSYRLNEAALAAAEKDWPRASALINDNLHRLRTGGRAAPAYIARCEDLVRQGPEAMKAGFLALTDEGQILRSIHPFAGLLLPRERDVILRQTRRRILTHEAQ